MDCVYCQRPIEGKEGRTCGAHACRSRYQVYLEQGRAVCAVCGQPLRGSREDQPCHAAACQSGFIRLTRMANATQPKIGRCQTCGIYTTTGSPGDWQCADPSCQSVRRKSERLEERRQAQARQLRLTRAAEELRSRMSLPTCTLPRDAFVLKVVPHYAAGLQPLATNRVDEFCQRLDQAVAAAFDPTSTAVNEPYLDEELSELMNPQESLVFGQACRLCRGNCCREGANHAFISAATIRRFASTVPQLTPAEVQDAYRKRLPAESVTGSCLFHTQHGCSLSREMRSNMCNRFLCPALLTVRQQLETDPPDGFFVAAAHEDALVGGQFVVTPDAQAPLATELGD